MEFPLDSNLVKATVEAKDIVRKEVEKRPITVQLFAKLNKDGKTEEFQTSELHCRKYDTVRINFLIDNFGMRGVLAPEEYDSITLIVKPIKPRQRPCPNCNDIMRADHITRHLKTCSKKGMCLICEKQVKHVNNHMKTCSVITYPCRVCDVDFNTGARRTAHEKKCRVADGEKRRVKRQMRFNHHTEETALGGLFRIVKIKPQIETSDYIGVLEDEMEHIKEILEFYLDPALKFYLTLNLDVLKLITEEKKTATFNTSATPLLQSDDTAEEIKKHIDRLDNKVDEFIRNGSGWVVENVKQIDVMMTKYDPMSYMFYSNPLGTSTSILPESDSDSDGDYDWKRDIF